MVTKKDHLPILKKLSTQFSYIDHHTETTTKVVRK